MDIADQAEAIEQQQRDAAIAHARQPKFETPLLNNEYQRICRDCEDIIPALRLIVAPLAVRCVPCQQERET